MSKTTMTIYLNDCQTTDLFWDCECHNEGDEKFEYIKPESLKQCPKCKCFKEDQPSSRINEVIEMLVSSDYLDNFVYINRPKKKLEHGSCKCQENKNGKHK